MTEEVIYKYLYPNLGLNVRHNIGELYSNIRKTVSLNLWLHDLKY